ncbi:hypothetical protein [Lysinibacillus sp. NPDC056232]|uniref:hypothetical protein n=1 Tax=Lysinibacillus sp. NPDC056232 TaxID=3345756 RepID=UPI0035E2F62B
MSRLCQQMFFARKRSANVATAARCFLHESEAAAAPMLVTKESPSLHSNQLIYIAYVLTNVIYVTIQSRPSFNIN